MRRFGDSSGSQQSFRFFGFGILASLLSAGMLWYVFSLRNQSISLTDHDDSAKENDNELEESDNKDDNATPKSSNSTKTASRITNEVRTTDTANVNSSKKNKQEMTHRQVEDADKRGKALFKAKKFLEAATCFTEALDLIENSDDSSLEKQAITLLNNRSAMYEKAGLMELALDDCDSVIKKDAGHTKARIRKLRLLESDKRYHEALVEVCAVQLRFMRENREKLRLGIPVQPPIPQDKIEQLMGHVLPEELELTVAKLNQKPRALPSRYTISQLLRSFVGFNAWMARAAKGDTSSELSLKLNNCVDDTEKATLLLNRGLRYMYDEQYEMACADFEAAYTIIQNKDDKDDTFEDYPRLLEWVGMCRHLHFDLPGALSCYEKCSDLEPFNAEILVKRAGVLMDSGKVEESLELFNAALGIDPDATDALLHRSNLRMLQMNPDEARKDLEKCLSLRPNHLLAQLRLATVLMAASDIDGAKQCLDKAERISPRSSEVHSYRGEMLFAQENFEDAKVEFDKAIEYEPLNPTPYVNAALAMMNTPALSGAEVEGAIGLLSKAIEVDPMFHAAYVHLGQLKLSMATTLDDARKVIALYDAGIEHCRTAEELRDICSMRILTVSQIDAASSLGMETLNMQ